MRKPLDTLPLFNSTLIALLIGGIIFVMGYAVSLQMLRSSIVKLTSNSVSSKMGEINSFIDSRLSIVEEATYSFTWAEDRHGSRFEKDDWSDEEQAFNYLELLLERQPTVCGAALALHPKQKIFTPQGKYGYALYVSNINGKLEHMRLGAINDYSKKEWFKLAYDSNDVCITPPFRESFANKIVTSISLPMRDDDGNAIGVFALDFNLESLPHFCKDIASLDNERIVILDRNYRIVSHPDTSKLLTDAFNDNSELWHAMSMYEEYNKGEESGMVRGMKDGVEYALYFSKIKRAGWTICVECPLEEIYKDANRLKSQTYFIAIVSVLIVAVLFILLYRRMRRAQLTKSSLEADMKIAKDLQMGMLPKSNPSFQNRKDLNVYGFLQPAKMVGGDLYYYLLRDEKLFFCIGDISGKGVPASMFMSIVMSHFQDNCKKTDSASEIVSSLNKILASENTDNIFCTFFLGILNLKDGHIDYCNAGHDAPFIMRKTADGYDIKPLPVKPNLVLGAFDDFVFAEEHTTINPGDSLFLFTDGVTEAENKKKNLFGLKATEDCLKKIFDVSGNESAEKKVTMILDVIHSHTQGAPQNDDITMMMVEYKDLPESSSKLII